MGEDDGFGHGSSSNPMRGRSCFEKTGLAAQRRPLRDMSLILDDLSRNVKP